MNIKLLNQIKKQIKKEPENFQMHTWHCGTAHCIGGWAEVITGLPLSYDSLDISHESLNLTHKQFNNLCLLAHWPEPYISQYFNAKTRKSKAAIAIRRINYFIKTGGL